MLRTLARWMPSLRSTSTPKARAPKPRTRLGVQRLDDRIVPAVLPLTVTSVEDVYSKGTLRYEVDQANRDAAAGQSDTIQFDTTKMGSKVIVLTQGQLELTAGAAKTTIDGSGLVTVQGNQTGRLFLVDYGATVTISGLAISGGKTTSGGGIYNIGSLELDSCRVDSNIADYGGGIMNTGNLTVNGGTINDNTASRNGAGLYNQTGGAATVCGTVISENTALSSADGGGVFNSNGAKLTTGLLETITTTAQGTTTITYTRTTLTDNTGNLGGGIFNQGSLSLSFTDISKNTAYEGGGIYSITYPSQMVYEDGSVSVSDNHEPEGRDTVWAEYR